MCNKTKRVVLTFFGEKKDYYKECELHLACDAPTTITREFDQFD